MARLLIRALQQAGHYVELISELRSFTKTPDRTKQTEICASAVQERCRITALWHLRGGKPDLWFTYHPYYKAPDLLGPSLASTFELPYITAEASYSKRREGDWEKQQSCVVDAVRQAAVNICFTARDQIGLTQITSSERLKRLPPFIDVTEFAARPSASDSHQLVTVAMMRPGDKLESYRMLAASLALLDHIPWRLKVVGDGPASGAVNACFTNLAQDRIEWAGQKQPHEITKILYNSGIYVWPGFGEAYGIAYLEAQAAGLPVVAQDVAGVPEVVRNGITGILTPVNDVAAFSNAIEQLCVNNHQRVAMGRAARQFVLTERSLELASQQLDQLLQPHV